MFVPQNHKLSLAGYKSEYHSLPVGRWRGYLGGKGGKEILPCYYFVLFEF